MKRFMVFFFFFVLYGYVICFAQRRPDYKDTVIQTPKGNNFTAERFIGVDIVTPNPTY